MPGYLLLNLLQLVTDLFLLAASKLRVDELNDLCEMALGELLAALLIEETRSFADPFLVLFHLS